MEEPIYSDAPGEEMDRHIGKCHICEQETRISFCPLCRHWICKEDRYDWFQRAWAALKERVGEPKPGCCGPKEGN